MKFWNFIEKYANYIIFILVLLIIIFIYIIFFNNNYENIENKMAKLAKEYIAENNILVTNDTYIEITKLGKIRGTNSCSQASGVIVIERSGKFDYLPYLSCLDYKSDILDYSSDYIELLGDKVVLLSNGEIYVEKGYTKQSNVVVHEESNFQDTPGVYRVKYNIFNNDTFVDSLERIIIVSENNKALNIDGSINENYPQITLLGDKEMSILYGGIYNEPGYSASSLGDGDLSSKVIVNGAIDTKKEGDQYISYTVTNSKGYSISIKRKVTIVKNAVLLETLLALSSNEPSKVVLINLSISGDGYGYTILPNGEKIVEKNTSYKVTENGKYIFKIYDSNDEEHIEEIEVTNVDNVVPTGSCVANFENKKVVITVNASDANGVKNYKYLIGTNEYNSENNTYSHTDKYTKSTVPTVKVEVSDNALNTATLSCSNEINIEPVVYTDVNGYNCLEPYVCYKQLDYTDPYRATENGMGTIYNAGCLPTSLTIAATKFNKRSANGQLYTPSTLVNEIIYPDGKIRGYSNYTRIEEVTQALNLKVTKIGPRDDNAASVLLNHLKNENPVVFLANGGCYSFRAHYLALIGANEQEQVFLTDPYRRDNVSMTGECPVNTWVSVEQVIKKGGIQFFALISE